MPITIKREGSRPEVHFGSLAFGDTFLYKNEVHMKVRITGCSSKEEYDTAIRLGTGTESYFSYNDLVIPVNEATLTYSMV